jgi:mediator of RNA polymerase II transcription subunit 17
MTVLADVVLTIRGRTFTLPATTTTYQVVIPESSPLQKLCPPYKEGYPDVGSLADYLRTLTTRLLTDHALKLLSSSYWTRNVKGTSLNHSSQDSKGDVELRFSIEDSEQDTRASVPVVVLEKTRSGDGKSDRQRWEWRPEGASEPRKLEEVLQDVRTEAT